MLVEGVGKTSNKPVEENKPKPQVAGQPPQAQETYTTTKKSEVQFSGAVMRLALEKKLPSNNVTPDQALEQIKNLPKPDTTSPQEVADYKQQVKGIADDAIKNS